MKSIMECTLLTMATNESKKTPGTFFSNVNVMQGDEVFNFNAENSLVEKLKPYKMKVVKLVLSITEFDGKKGIKAIDISL